MRLLLFYLFLSALIYFSPPPVLHFPFPFLHSRKFNANRFNQVKINVFYNFIVSTGAFNKCKRAAPEGVTFFSCSSSSSFVERDRNLGRKITLIKLSQLTYGCCCCCCWGRGVLSTTRMQLLSVGGWSNQLTLSLSLSAAAAAAAAYSNKKKKKQITPFFFFFFLLFHPSSSHAKQFSACYTINNNKNKHSTAQHWSWFRVGL